MKTPQGTPIHVTLTPFPALLAGLLFIAVNTAIAGDVLVLIGKDAYGSKIVPTNSITILANEVLTFNGPLETFGVNGEVGNSPPAGVFSFTFKKDTFEIRGVFDKPHSFPGPGELKLDTNLCDACGSPSWATFRTNSGAIVRLTSSLQGFPPDRTVVIPSGSPGANIGLEMSSDLLTWTPTQLGTYTAPTNHLFFRLKMQPTP
ncbi:MAG: hypothetical protein E6R03_03645 [Hyphomicrobiaceae bacterium]|nr:MAG: hypothetical protein E6R03_03645 [Hyphomicrobiaceae bacterium]